MNGLTTAKVVLGWMLVLSLLSLGFGLFYERQTDPNRNLESRRGDDGTVAVALTRNRSGHYIAPGLINGVPVTFLVDTGATDVAVPEQVARQAGLKPGPGIKSQTAAGVVTMYATRIDSVQLGDIIVRDVRGTINPHMPGNTVLLGMSFLRQLELVQRGRELTLRQH